MLKLKGKRKARTLGLTGKSQGNDDAGSFIEDIVTDNENWQDSGRPNGFRLSVCGPYIMLQPHSFFR